MESNSLTKALGLLEATAGHPEGRSLAELASEVGMPKPTAHRILKTLTALGYLERPASGVYRQSPQVKRLVSDAAVRRLIDAATRPLRELFAPANRRNTLLSCLVFFLYGGAVGGLIFYLPTYFQEERGYPPSLSRTNQSRS